MNERSNSTSCATKDALQGAIAGAIGGIVGTWTMGLFEQLWTRLMLDKGQRRDPEMIHRLGNAGEGSAHQAQSEPRSHHQRLTPSERLAAIAYRTILHRPAKPRERHVVGSAIHYGFGATAGAVYGAAAEANPLVTTGAGTLFGTAVWLAVDEVGISLTGLAQPPQRTPLRRHAYSLGAHFAYGLGAELTRRAVRAVLTR